MEKEEEEKPKKETGCLFYNFDIKKNQTPLLTEIKNRNSKIKQMCDDMNTDAEKYLDIYLKKNWNYYKYWMKYLSPKSDNPKNKINNNKPSLNSKIYFGSFFNQNSQFDGMDDVKKYENLKNIITKSSNFTFIKNPKSIKYSKLPNNLYLSKEDSIKLKELNSIKNTDTDNNNNTNNIISRNKSSNDNSYLNNNILYTNINIEDEEDNQQIKEEIKKKIYKLKYNNYSFFDNKQKNKRNNITLLKKINNSNNSSNSILSPITQNNSTDEFKSSQNIKLEENKTSSPNILKLKNIEKKNKSHSNLYKVSNIYTNLEKNNNSYSNLFNQTYNKQNVYLSQKDLLYINIQDKLNRITRYKTPKKSIQKLSNLSKLKCRNKMKKITKLIKKNNSEYIGDTHELMKLLKENKNKKKQKSLRNQFYYDMKNQLRLLSVVDKLKNIKDNAPVKLMKHLNKDYYEKSKEMIVDDKNTKKINNIYRSSTEGKIIKDKFSDKTNYINKFVNKNKRDVVKLKNKYEKCDLLVGQIVEENNVNNYKILAWINKKKKLKKKLED